MLYVYVESRWCYRIQFHTAFGENTALCYVGKRFPTSKKKRSRRKQSQDIHILCVCVVDFVFSRTNCLSVSFCFVVVVACCHLCGSFLLCAPLQQVKSFLFFIKFVAKESRDSTFVFTAVLLLPVAACSSYR